MGQTTNRTQSQTESETNTGSQRQTNTGSQRQTTSNSLTQSQNKEGRTETYTRTETVQPGGRTITTTTHTSTANMNASFGLKANANLSGFILRDMAGYRSDWGYGASAGVFLKLESRHFALQYELMLQYKTSAMKNQVDPSTSDYQYWGLELPIYCMGQINTGSGKIFVGAGPYLGFGLDAKQDPANIDLYRKDETTGKAIMHRWDFGLGALAGYEFKNGISLHAGYQVGLINQLSAEKNAMSMKNKTACIGVGYKF
jgi:hypothetical protein